MKKRDERGNLYLLTALVLGVVAGLVYGWLIWPVSYTSTAPNALRIDFKERYRVLIAEAFLANRDIGRASSRLALLGDMDSVVALTLQAQRSIAEGRPDSEVQALTYLMLALSQGADNPVQLPTLVTPIGLPTIVFSSTATATFVPVFTATPVIQPDINITGTITSPGTLPLPATPTPTAVTDVPFALLEKILVCDQLQESPMLQIEAQDASGTPIPGVSVTIRREDQNDGEEKFFTGLKPEISLGYADFTMRPDVNYTLWLGEGGQPIEIEPPACPDNPGDGWGIWKLLFQQP